MPTWVPLVCVMSMLLGAALGTWIERKNQRAIQRAETIRRRIYGC